MLSLVPVGHFRNIFGHLFTWLVCGYFQWRHGLLFTDCIVWEDKDEVIGFKRLHWISLGRWSTGSPKFQLFQLSQRLQVTIGPSISSSAYFPWNIPLKKRKCSYLKVPEIKSYILSRGHSVFRRKNFFSGGLSLEAIHQSSWSSFLRLLCKDYQGKLRTLLEALHSKERKCRNQGTSCSTCVCCSGELHCMSRAVLTADISRVTSCSRFTISAVGTSTASPCIKFCEREVVDY